MVGTNPVLVGGLQIWVGFLLFHSFIASGFQLNGSLGGGGGGISLSSVGGLFRFSCDVLLGVGQSV